ncbi:MAG TPA: EF-hand domain-containing protein [Bosea sp. (in: a-proteobacteria)]|jgi:Ca2+-binding EF-hand superfamily protein|uniref:EF-hand domain-containing protein n=1 Tax=Bosea sp. (in: a-proteobacteria) TaxID=1871050 RepID=UPI002DDD4F5C|nr:EF-hand domain-containing protein [Bosea sp. (in: a-proteobacteria)]HEV2556309.1 EF-hand domain-containing protein [Bosea sp. (in: a-proteobacteria)]
MSSISGVSGGFRPPPPKPPSFESVDTDSSGSLSIEEFKAGAPKGAASSKSEELFKAIDSDSNGSVTQEEQDAFKAKAEQAQQQLQSFLFGLQAGGQSESSGDESEEETDIFAQLDANSDGSVAKDEFLSAFSSGTSSSSDLLSKLFDAIDSSSDGSISKDEQSSFQAALEQRGRPSGPPPGPPPGSASQAYGSTYQLGAANASGTTYSQAA